MDTDRFNPRPYRRPPQGVTPEEQPLSPAELNERERLRIFQEQRERERERNFENRRDFREPEQRPQQQFFENSIANRVSDLASNFRLLGFGVLLALLLGIAGTTTGIVGIFYPENSGSGSAEFSCTTDADCLNFEITSVCIGAFCNELEGTCFTDFLNETFNCDSNTICGAGMICQDCVCVEDTAAPVCREDSDCLNVTEVFVCSTAVCNNMTETCEVELLPGNECETDNLCPGLQVCTDCLCTDPHGVNGTLSCVVDSDCVNLTATNMCINAFCDVMTERCNTELGPGFDCNGDDSQCPSGQICQDCVCTDLCDGVVCDTDACKTEACDPFTGTCVVVDVVEDCCVDDSSCGDINWSTCFDYFCDGNNKCSQNLTMGSECAVDENCMPGFVCQNCLCVASNATGDCMIDDDCPSLDYSVCVVNTCNGGVCVPALNGGAMCSDDSLCSTGEFCNETCQCEQRFPGFTLSSSGTITTSGAVVTNIDYEIYASGNLRIWTNPQGVNDICVGAPDISGGFIAVIDRPPTPIFVQAYVDNLGLLLGTIRFDTNGLVTWNTAVDLAWTPGQCRIRANTILYAV